MKRIQELDDIKEMLEYLDELREESTVNMYGSAPYLQIAFHLDRERAKDVVLYWMETFEERHNE